MPLVECVPNVSEGRRADTLAALAAAARGVEGARLLSLDADADHHRAVLTLAGELEPVAEAAFRVVALAVERIDIRDHVGVHPRIGAADVVPFVPLGDTPMETCVDAARALGRRIGDELGVPVYYYGEAALRPSRTRLPDVRRGGLEALGRGLGTDPERAPDAGSSTLHPTAGASAVGARPFLVAFNVNLDSTDLGLARRIAGALRERDGGLPGIRALGFLLDDAGTAQVSTNVCDFRLTSLTDVFEAVVRLAGDAGVAVRESELVGLAPAAALDGEIARAVRLRGYDPDRCILENVLAQR